MSGASIYKRCLRADWRDTEHYRSLYDYDCNEWAGEWLLRNKDFIADLQRAPCHSRPEFSNIEGGVRFITCTEDCPMARWGLRCCHMDGDKPLFFWLPERNSQVLMVEAVAAANGEAAFDLRQCPLLKAVLRGAGQELHLLFSDGARTLQLEVRGAPVLENPVVLKCTLRGFKEFETKPLTLQRLSKLYRVGRLVKSLYPKERRAYRWIEMLRAWDGLQSGARYRDIGAAIYGDRGAHEDWHAGYRYRVLRLVKCARQMTGGGYLALLQGQAQKKISAEPGET